MVATAPTVYGIETTNSYSVASHYFASELQQHLPFTVLKLKVVEIWFIKFIELQQHLPFTVLKLHDVPPYEY